MVLPCSDRVSRAPPYSRTTQLSTRTRLSLSQVSLSMLFRFFMSRHLACPISLATTLGVSFDFLSFRYLDVSVPWVRFINLCIQLMIPIKSVGSPIRIFTDHRSLSSPHDFSQSATSFFASNRQGIHQMPFFFLDSHYAYVKSYQSYIPYNSFCLYYTSYAFFWTLFFYSYPLINFFIFKKICKYFSKTSYIFRYTRYTSYSLFSTSTLFSRVSLLRFFPTAFHLFFGGG